MLCLMETVWNSKNGIPKNMIEEKSLSLENALLVGVINSRQNEEQSKEYLDELEFLTYTAGGKVLKRFTQKIDPPNPKTFIGSGKMQEVLEFVKTQDVSSVIFDEGFNISLINWLIFSLLSFDDKIVILSTKFLSSLTFPGQL